MDSIRGLLDENTLQSIAKAAGRGVTEKQVEDVLNAVLPAIEKDSASGTLVSRTNAAVEEQQTVTRSGGTRAGGLDLLSLLLGGNASTATQTAASNAHVSNGQASSILKIAAPILLFLLLKNKLGGSSNSGGGLLGSLLGGGSSNGSLLGSLLGGGSAQPVQQQSSNDSLLGMLLGGGNDADTSAGSSLLGSLLSDSTPAQPVQQQSAGSGSLLGSLLGGGSSQQSGGGSLLGSLLGGSSQPAQQQSGQQAGDPPPPRRLPRRPRRPPRRRPPPPKRQRSKGGVPWQVRAGISAPEASSPRKKNKTCPGSPGL